jgi:hypothetical protein
MPSRTWNGPTVTRASIRNPNWALTARAVFLLPALVGGIHVFSFSSFAGMAWMAGISLDHDE